MVSELEDLCISNASVIAVGSIFYELPLKTRENGIDAFQVCEDANGSVGDFQNIDTRNIFHSILYSYLRKGIFRKFVYFLFVILLKLLNY